MKLESLVIANQHVAVNTFPGLVHTARHTMGVGNARNGLPYYMMDLLQFSGLDLDHLDGPVRLEVNGEECGFRYVIKPRDRVMICYA